jgi:hypothetical protein
MQPLPFLCAAEVQKCASELSACRAAPLPIFQVDFVMKDLTGFFGLQLGLNNRIRGADERVSSESCGSVASCSAVKLTRNSQLGVVAIGADRFGKVASLLRGQPWDLVLVWNRRRVRFASIL